jgi:hypothetical protein
MDALVTELTLKDQIREEYLEWTTRMIVLAATMNYSRVLVELTKWVSTQCQWK